MFFVEFVEKYSYTNKSSLIITLIRFYFQFDRQKTQSMCS